MQEGATTSGYPGIRREEKSLAVLFSSRPLFPASLSPLLQQQSSPPIRPCCLSVCLSVCLSRIPRQTHSVMITITIKPLEWKWLHVGFRHNSSHTPHTHTHTHPHTHTDTPAVAGVH